MLVTPDGLKRLFRLDGNFKDESSEGKDLDRGHPNPGHGIGFEQSSIPYGSGDLLRKVARCIGHGQARGDATGLPSTGERTIAGWFKYESNTWTGPFGYGSPVLNKAYAAMIWSSTLRLDQWGLSSNEAGADVGTPVDRNIWYHVAYMWDGTKNSFYLNGNFTSEKVLTGNDKPQTGVDASGNIFHGNVYLCGNANAYTFKGWIADFAIFDRALTANEVSNIYENYDALNMLTSEQQAAQQLEEHQKYLNALVSTQQPQTFTFNEPEAFTGEWDGLASGSNIVNIPFDLTDFGDNYTSFSVELDNSNPECLDAFNGGSLTSETPDAVESGSGKIGIKFSNDGKTYSTAKFCTLVKLMLSTSGTDETIASAVVSVSVAPTDGGFGSKTVSVTLSETGVKITDQTDLNFTQTDVTNIGDSINLSNINSTLSNLLFGNLITIVVLGDSDTYLNIASTNKDTDMLSLYKTSKKGLARIDFMLPLIEYTKSSITLDIEVQWNTDSPFESLCINDSQDCKADGRRLEKNRGLQDIMSEKEGKSNIPVTLELVQIEKYIPVTLDIGSKSDGYNIKLSSSAAAIGTIGGLAAFFFEL